MRLLSALLLEPEFWILLTLALFAGEARGQQPSGKTAATQSSAPALPQPQPVQPKTITLDNGGPGDDPLLAVPPPPKGRITLVGGVVRHIDPIRNRMTVDPFASKQSMKVLFDERTHIYRDGVETTQLGIRKGDHVYVDTMLDQGHVFARNIQVRSQVGSADASGQVLSFDAHRRVLTLRDRLSSAPLSFQLAPDAVISKQHQPGSVADLRPGSLVGLRFGSSGRDRVAREVSVIAVPGTSFTFSGKVTHLDVHTGLLAVDNDTDQKSYDINFDPHVVRDPDSLGLGAHVTVLATFETNGYRASDISVDR